MGTSAGGAVTQLLVSWGKGDSQALERLMPLVYGELRRMAARYLRREPPEQTLQPTALVHEAYLLLVDQKSVQWQNRAHFFGVSAQLMRRILVDHARRRAAGKRGSGATRVSFEENLAMPGRQDVGLLDLDRALRGLEKLDPQQGRIVELRFFGGLSIDETAECVGLSAATVKREWGIARAWLHREISGVT